MSNVIELPISSKMKGKRTKLDVMITTLDSKLREIRRQAKYMTELQTDFNRTQETYNAAVADYAAIHNNLNIPLKYLNYASNLKIDADTGEINVNTDS